MDFTRNDEQQAFAEAIDDVIEGSGGTAVARAWGTGYFEPGIALWEQFAELGLAGLRVPEEAGGMGGSLSDLAVIFERLGYHAAPGPFVESIALLPGLVSPEQRDAIAGGAMASAAVEGVHPYALNAAAAQLHFLVSEEAISAASPTETLESISPMRHLSRLVASGASVPLERALVARALDEASVANSAMLIGAGERLLSEAVEYAKIREQFGRPIGEYQALKHQLANVRIALTFARPLLWQASIALDAGAETAARDVSAAKVRAAEAAGLAARVSLQVHGAIGYTAEHDLSLWLNWVPALIGTWGTPAYHRNRIAQSVLV